MDGEVLAAFFNKNKTLQFQCPLWPSFSLFSPFMQVVGDLPHSMYVYFYISVHS